MSTQAAQQTTDKNQLHIEKNKILQKLISLTKQQQTCSATNDRLLELIKQAEKLAPSQELNENLRATYAMLTNQLSLEDYLKKAEEAQEKPSLGLKIFSGLMIALGLAFIILGIAFLICGIATFDGPMIGIACPAALEIGGILMVFCDTFFRSAPNKTMKEFYEFKKDKQVEYRDEDCESLSVFHSHATFFAYADTHFSFQEETNEEGLVESSQPVFC